MKIVLAFVVFFLSIDVGFRILIECVLVVVSITSSLVMLMNIG